MEHIHERIHTHAPTHMDYLAAPHTHAHPRKHSHGLKCMLVCTNTYACSQTTVPLIRPSHSCLSDPRTYTHAHIHMDTHTHTYIHIHTHTRSPTWTHKRTEALHALFVMATPNHHSLAPTHAQTPPPFPSLSLCHHPSLSLAHMTHTVSCPLVAMSADHLSLSSSLPVSLTHTHTVSCPLVATLAYSSARVWYRSMFNLLSSALILLPRPQQE